MTLDPLKAHVRDWEEMASADPFRAISGLKKDWEIEEFFATAKPHMDQFFAVASSIGLPKSYERALEFGCGAGRFLRRFEPRFKDVWGVDASQTMIDLARVHNPRCKFHLNNRADLRFFPDRHFDLVYSFLVLQHLPDRALICQYLKEFMRVLRPGGLAAFQIPDRLTLRWKIQPRRRIYHFLHAIGLSPARLQSWNLLPMSLIAVPEHIVESVIRESGGSVCTKKRLGGNDGVMYYCTK